MQAAGLTATTPAGYSAPMTDKPDYGDTFEAMTIADMVSAGTTLIDACRAFDIPITTIYSRIAANPKFRDMMERAREIGFDVLANECLSIADDGTNDYVEKVNRRTGEAYEALDKEHIARSKLRVETRLKLLAKWHPKKYGEKLQVEQKTATVAIPISDDPIEAQRAYEALMKGD